MHYILIASRRFLRICRSCQNLLAMIRTNERTTGSKVFDSFDVNTSVSHFANKQLLDSKGFLHHLVSGRSIVVAETTNTGKNRVGECTSLLCSEFRQIDRDVIVYFLAGGLEFLGEKARVSYLAGRTELAGGAACVQGCAARFGSRAAALKFLDEAICAAIAVDLASSGIANLKAVYGGETRKTVAENIKILIRIVEEADGKGSRESVVAHLKIVQVGQFTIFSWNCTRMNIIRAIEKRQIIE